MSAIDELELGKTIGRIEGKMDAMLNRVANIEQSLSKKIDEHDGHLDTIRDELAEKRGAAVVWGSVAGVAVMVLSKVAEKVWGHL